MDDTSLLAPISAEAPCGPDLEYDAAFVALENSLNVAYADRAVGPEDDVAGVDWKQVAVQAQALLMRSRDLRIAVVLTKARLHLEGIAGLTRGLQLLQQLLSSRWGSLHPQLGAQGDTDGLMRVNALRGLCDGVAVIAPLRKAPLLQARGLRALSLRDLENAMAGTAQPDGTAPDTTTVEASFIGCDLDALAVTVERASEAHAAALALEQLFTEHGTPAVLRLPELMTQLEAIAAHLGPRLRARRAALVIHENVVEDEVDGLALGADWAAPSPRIGHGPAGSRAEVLQQLDRLCAYYDTHEPTSPVPMLLRRARRLANMSFFELVRELAPGGSVEIETLRGPEQESQS